MHSRHSKSPEFVQRPEFEIIRKYRVSETGSISVFRWRKTDNYSYESLAKSQPQILKDGVGHHQGSCHYHNLLPWMIEHQVCSNTFPYLSGYGQPDCGFSHLDTSKYVYRCCDVGALYFGCAFLDVATFTTLTPLSLQTSCKISFWIVDLKCLPCLLCYWNVLTKFSYRI
jgi:hypothetical protein